MKKLYLLLSVLFLIGCTEKNPINIDLLRSSKDHSIYYSKETNEPYSGPVFYLDEDDNVFLQGPLKNGEKNGDWIYWDRYGNKIEGIVSEKVSSTFTGVMFDFFNFWLIHFHVMMDMIIFTKSKFIGVRSVKVTMQLHQKQHESS